jgi:hypothetical protein
MATEYCNKLALFHFESPFGTPADGVSASLLHPPLPALQLKLVFVIERIHDQPQL